MFLNYSIQNETTNPAMFWLKRVHGNNCMAILEVVLSIAKIKTVPWTRRYLPYLVSSSVVTRIHEYVM